MARVIPHVIGAINYSDTLILDGKRKLCPVQQE
jgi:hypothetical protein